MKDELNAASNFSLWLKKYINKRKKAKARWRKTRKGRTRTTTKLLPCSVSPPSSFFSSSSFSTAAHLKQAVAGGAVVGAAERKRALEVLDGHPDGQCLVAVVDVRPTTVGRQVLHKALAVGAGHRTQGPRLWLNYKVSTCSFYF